MPAEHSVEVGIRGLSIADLPSVIDIENSSSPSPWTEKDFDRHLRRKNSAAFVVVSEGKVIAFAVLEVFKEFFQLINFAVHPLYRRRGVGHGLITYITKQLIPTKRKRIIIEVRESNLAAQLFLRENKYRAVEIMQAHYDDTGEDCFKMEFRLQWPDKAVRRDTKGAFARKTVKS
jgi:[ribosomal protein S18]-alanine N-acetyltransferase